MQTVGGNEHENRKQQCGTQHLYVIFCAFSDVWSLNKGMVDVPSMSAGDGYIQLFEQIPNVCADWINQKIGLRNERKTVLIAWRERKSSFKTFQTVSKETYRFELYNIHLFHLAVYAYLLRCTCIHLLSLIKK